MKIIIDLKLLQTLDNAKELERELELFICKIENSKIDGKFFAGVVSFKEVVRPCDAHQPNFVMSCSDCMVI